MYINQRLLELQRTRRRWVMILAGVWGGFWAIGVVTGVDMWTEDGGKVFRTSLVLSLFGVVPLVIMGLRQRRLNAALRLSSLLIDDRDGILTLADISGIVGMPRPKLDRWLNELLSAGVLRNAYLDLGGNPASLVLTRPEDARGQRHCAVICPRCGTNTMVRVGFVASCASCGSPIALS